jgi:hypothetical protein
MSPFDPELDRLPNYRRTHGSGATALTQIVGRMQSSLARPRPMSGRAWSIPLLQRPPRVSRRALWFEPVESSSSTSSFCRRSRFRRLSDRAQEAQSCSDARYRIAELGRLLTEAPALPAGASCILLPPLKASRGSCSPTRSSYSRARFLGTGPSGESGDVVDSHSISNRRRPDSGRTRRKYESARRQHHRRQPDERRHWSKTTRTIA